MQIVVGPVLTRKSGYAFDCWTPEQGLSPGYTYGRVEDAHYARNVEIRSRKDETMRIRLTPKATTPSMAIRKEARHASRRLPPQRSPIPALAA